jgi:hypothetical protein
MRKFDLGLAQLCDGDFVWRTASAGGFHRKGQIVGRKPAAMP